MDDAGFRRTNALTQKNGSAWYIAFLEGRVTVMRIVRDRDEAIALACAMLDEGVEVTGVGPMLDTGQEKIDLPSLQEICRQRRRVGMWNKTTVTPLPGAHWAPKPRGEEPRRGTNGRNTMDENSANPIPAVIPRALHADPDLVSGYLGLGAANLQT